MTWLYVFVGGGSGAVLRAALGTQLESPWSTLTCNLLGSFLLVALLHPSVGAATEARAALGTGLLGGFTTYSTFNHELVRALQDGQPVRAAALAAGTLAGCLLAGALGWLVAARLAGAAPG